MASVSSLPVAGIGVALDSDVLSADSGGATDGEGSGLTFADGVCLEEGGLLDGKRDSRSDEMASLTILLFFADLDVALALGVLMVGDGCVDVGVVVVVW